VVGWVYKVVGWVYKVVGWVYKVNGTHLSVKGKLFPHEGDALAHGDGDEGGVVVGGLEGVGVQAAHFGGLGG
jgi:hypothetical protein